MFFKERQYKPFIDVEVSEFIAQFIQIIQRELCLVIGGCANVFQI